MTQGQPQTAPRAGKVPCRAFLKPDGLCRVWELHFLDLPPVTVWFAGPVDFETVMARHPAALAAVPLRETIFYREFAGIQYRYPLKRRLSR